MIDLRLHGAEIAVPRIGPGIGAAKPDQMYRQTAEQLRHPGTRPGLLVALYREFDARQTAVMDAALAASQPSLADRATA